VSELTGLLASMEPHCKRIEVALDAHPRLYRIPTIQGEPCFSISRLGVTVRVMVKAKGKAHPKEVTGDGMDFETAASDLIRSLDIWAEVFLGKRG
jgi:hypothetical protein